VLEKQYIFVTASWLDFDINRDMYVSMYVSKRKPLRVFIRSTPAHIGIYKVYATRECIVNHV